jgi:hypothetical protein
MVDLHDRAIALRFIARTDIPTSIADLPVHARIRTCVPAGSLLSRHRRLTYA